MHVGDVHSIYNDSEKVTSKQLAITAPPWSASDAYLIENVDEINPSDTSG